MSWDIFRGGQDAWNRSEKAERFTEATARHARLQRDAYESIDKAWNARTVTQTRITALTGQLEADRKTIAAFQKEYELGQRSLIDLLNAQNQFFNAQVSLTSARAVVVFADYQLLAATGTLIEYLKAPPLLTQRRPISTCSVCRITKYRRSAGPCRRPARSRCGLRCRHRRPRPFGCPTPRPRLPSRHSAIASPGSLRLGPPRLPACRPGLRSAKAPAVRSCSIAQPASAAHMPRPRSPIGC